MATTVSRNASRMWLPCLAIAALSMSVVFQVLAVTPWDGALWTVAFPLLLASYPNGRFVPSWTKWPVAIYGLLAVVYLVADGSFASAPWWVAVALVQLGFFIPSCYRYMRRLDTTEREQVRWALLGALVGMLGILALLLFAAVSGGSINDLGSPAIVLSFLFLACFPLGPVIGLAAPHVLNVDHAIRSVLTIGFTGSLLALAFWGVTSIHWTNDDAGVLAWLGAAAVGILAVPAARLAIWVSDKIVYGTRSGTAEAIVELGRRLGSQEEADDVPSILVELVRQALGLSFVRMQGGWFATVSCGTNHVATSFPVSYRGELVATVDVGPVLARAL